MMALGHGLTSLASRPCGFSAVHPGLGLPPPRFSIVTAGAYIDADAYFPSLFHRMPCTPPKLPRICCACRSSGSVRVRAGSHPSRRTCRAGVCAARGATVGAGDCTLGCTVQQQRHGDHAARPSITNALADGDVATEAAQSMADALSADQDRKVPLLVLKRDATSGGVCHLHRGFSAD